MDAQTRFLSFILLQTRKFAWFKEAEVSCLSAETDVGFVVWLQKRGAHESGPSGETRIADKPQQAAAAWRGWTMTPRNVEGGCLLCQNIQKVWYLL